MFGFGGLSEVLFILFVAMLIFGPAKMPEIARMLAKGMAEVRKASNELKRTLNAELAISEQEKEAARLHPQAAAPFPPPPPPAPPAWSGGETVPQLEAAGAPAAALPESGEAVGSGETGTGSEAAAGSSEGAASNEGSAGSQAPESSDAALSSDAAYHAAWPEDGSSPAPSEDSGAPAAADSAPAAAAPDSAAQATHLGSAGRDVPAGTVAQGTAAVLEPSGAGDGRHSA
jgi:TatA/E family protein of Tat protein translocase